MSRLLPGKTQRHQVLDGSTAHPKPTERQNTTPNTFFNLVDICDLLPTGKLFDDTGLAPLFGPPVLINAGTPGTIGTSGSSRATITLPQRVRQRD